MSNWADACKRLGLRGILVGLCLGLPVPVFAQTHPCDKAVPTTYQVQRNTVLRVGFCHSQQEDDGTPIPLGQLHGYLVTDAGTLLKDLGMVAPVTGPSVSGDYYFEPAVTFTVSADVRVTVQVEYNGVRALQATPILLDVRGGPKAPSGTRIVISE